MTNITIPNITHIANITNITIPNITHIINITNITIPNVTYITIYLYIYMSGSLLPLPSADDAAD